MHSAVRYKLVKECTNAHQRTHKVSWSVTIIRIMCSLQRSSWTSFVMKICMILLIAFILKCILCYRRCDESCGYISKSDPSVLIWALRPLFCLKHNLFPGTQAHEYAYSVTAAHKHVYNHQWLTVSGKLNVLR